jgi:hypothetical protein
MSSRRPNRNTARPRSACRGPTPILQAGGGRTWWAHVEFTRMNTTPTFLCKTIQDLREARALISDHEREHRPVWPALRVQRAGGARVHSARRAAVASTRDALNAGNELARNPIVASTPAAPTSVIGSRGDRPKSRLLALDAIATASTPPSTRPRTNRMAISLRMRRTTRVRPEPSANRIAIS